MRLILIVGIPALILFLAAATHAGAEVVTSAEFGSGGSGAGELTHPGGIAVSPDGTDVYVADTGNQRIDEFTAEGEFVRAWGWGVRDGISKFETCDPTSECLRGQAGQGAGQLNEPVGVAVSPDGGTVYAINRARSDGRILRFAVSESAVAYKGTLPAGYGKDGGAKAGFGFPLPATNDLAVDPEDGTVYVADENAEEGPRIVAFDPAANTYGHFGVSAEGGITALAVGPTGKLYVGDGNGQVIVLEGGQEVARYEPGLPRVTAIAVRSAAGALLIESESFEQDEGQSTLRLTELAPGGTSTGTIRVGGVDEPTGGEPAPFGLALDPEVELPDRERGVVYVANPFAPDHYTSRILVLAERTPGKPNVGAPAVAQTFEGADLSVSVTPEGTDTHVYFEYGTTPTYGAAVPIPPGVDIGSDFGSQTITAHLSGLAPGTTYHVRVVATNADGTETGEDRTFTTLATEAPFSLPDNRVWEQVTSEKGAKEIAEANRPQAAVEGGAISFVSKYPLPASRSGAIYSRYAVFRATTGWSTRGVSTPLETGPGGLSEDTTALTSPDLLYSVADSRTELTGNAPPGSNFYLLDNLTGAATLMTPYRDAGAEGAPGEAVGASNDFGRIFFTGSGRLSPDTPAGVEGSSLYEYSAGALRDIGVLPGASAPTTGGVTVPRTITRPVSEDGSRVYFLAAPAPGEAPQLFVRIDGSRTVEVSAPQRATPEAEASEQEPTLVRASGDGRYAFFTSSAELTEDAYTGEVPRNEEGEPERKDAPNLYRYDLATGKLIDLTVAGDPADRKLGADVTGAIASADGTAAYFIADGRLAEGGTPGVSTLYRWTEGGGVALVASAEGDTTEFGPATARVTADGSVLALTANAPLAADFPHVSTEEIYRYAPGEGSLVCISCTHTLPEEEQAQATIGLGSAYGSNVLSADGGRVFLETSGALVSNDTDRTTDVYEWEGGADHLISTGTSRNPSFLLDASASGDDVFFTTTDRLAQTDEDQGYDVYDARVGGGFGSPAASSVPCEGEECLAPTQATPSAAPLGSRSFNGPANARAKHRHKKHHRKKHRRHRHHERKSRKHDRSGRRSATGKRR